MSDGEKHGFRQIYVKYKATLEDESLRTEVGGKGVGIPNPYVIRVVSYGKIHYVRAES
jgi:hypothetical protein